MQQFLVSRLENLTLFPLVGLLVFLLHLDCSLFVISLFLWYYFLVC